MSYTRGQFFIDVLKSMGNDAPLTDIVNFLIGWSIEESGHKLDTMAVCNLLNTTQELDGSTQFNSAKVQNYKNYTDGVQATVETLSNGDYPNLVHALVTNDIASLETAMTSAIQGELSVWVSGKASPIDTTYIANVLSLAQNTGTASNDILVGCTDGSSGTQGANMSLVLNSQGMVLDIVKVNQLEINESQELCGNYGAAVLRYAGLPNKGPSGTAEQVDQLADQLATLDNAGPVDEQGSIIPDMYAYFTSVVDSNGNRLLHWQDISPDEASIKAALNAGYPVLVTANEQNIRSTVTGKKPPYEWNINANHVIPLLGIDSAGNYIVPDYLNDYTGTGDTFPAHYDASILSPSWASVIQVVGNPSQPWLAPIPGATPTTWTAGFNAQLFAQTQPPVPPPTNSHQLQQLTDVWNTSGPLFHALGLTSPPMTTGIAVEWLDYMTRYFIGPPVTPEFNTVDWNGSPIVVQLFTCGMAQWSNSAGKARWWIADKEVTK